MVMQMNKKRCRTCKNWLHRTAKKGSNGAFIYVDSKQRLSRNNQCGDCTNKQARENWKNPNDKRKLGIKHYEAFTIDGYIMRKYRNMLSRVRGIQKLKAHLYANKQILTKDEFYKWAKNHEDFKTLWSCYIKNNRQRSLAPSIERIDPKKGYIVENMEWITHSENSKRGAISRHRQHRKDAKA